MPSIPTLKFKPLREQLAASGTAKGDAPLSSAARRSLADIAVDRNAQTLAARAAVPPSVEARGEQAVQSFWRNVLRWRVEHIGNKRTPNLRDMTDAVSVNVSIKRVGP